MDNLTQSSTIWPQIKSQLENMNAIGPAMPLGCKKHPDNRSLVACRNDFKGLPTGGCSVRCATKLLCGHVCPEYCHVLDPDHEKEFSCQKPCEKMACDQHRCSKRCGEICGDCSMLVEKELPCGHSAFMKCANDPAMHNCTAIVTVALKGCAHTQDKLCYKKSKTKCLTPCSVINSCGHMCAQLCHNHQPYCDSECHEFVEKTLICGHTKFVRCRLKLSISDTVKCSEPCVKMLSCGHPCKNSCGEECSQCDAVVEKTFPCGHQQLMECSELLEDSMCREPCKLELPCGHSCTSTCSQPCSATSCEEIVKCDVEPACGHGFIYMPCHLNTKDLKSDSDELLQYCMAPCRAQMDCGHTCSGVCGPCVQGRVHVPCTSKCSKTLPCGHRCMELCGAECPALCNQPCLHTCQHRTCSNICGQSCSPCKNRCERRCVHQVCSRPCSEECDCPPCDLPCPRSRPCGHTCAGFCGESCPQACPHCTPAAFQFTGYTVKPDHRFVVLEDCSHPVEETLLRELVSSNDGTPRCPVCTKQITKSRRFKENLRKFYLKLTNAKELKRKMIAAFISKWKIKIRQLSSDSSHLEKYGEAACFIQDHLKNGQIHYKTSAYIYTFFQILVNPSTTGDNIQDLEKRKVILKALSLRVSSMSSWDMQQFKSEIPNLKLLPNHLFLSLLIS